MLQRLNGHHISGHGLLEVLVALALTSVGILGFLHTQQLRETAETALLARTHAVMLAQDIARKINANPDALSAYHTALGAAPVFTTDCRRSVCDRQALAAFHLAQWKCRLGRWVRHTSCRERLKTRGMLRYGDGDIRVHGGIANITVHWLDADQTPQSFAIHHALLGD